MGGGRAVPNTDYLRALAAGIDALAEDWHAGSDVACRFAEEGRVEMLMASQVVGRPEPTPARLAQAKALLLVLRLTEGWEPHQITAWASSFNVSNPPNGLLPRMLAVVMALETVVVVREQAVQRRGARAGGARAGGPPSPSAAAPVVATVDHSQQTDAGAFVLPANSADGSADGGGGAMEEDGEVRAVTQAAETAAEAEALRELLALMAQLAPS